MSKKQTILAISCLVLIFGFKLSGQSDSLLLYSKYPSGRPFEKYYARSSDSLRHGSCQIFLNNGEIWAEGQYKLGKRSGIWTFHYTEGNSKFKAHFDFDLNMEVDYQAKVPVRNTAEAKAKNIQSQVAHFPGGLALFYQYLQEAQAKASILEGLPNLKVHFIITPSGRIDSLCFSLAQNKASIGEEGFKLYSFSNPKQEAYLKALFTAMPLWYPHIANYRPQYSDWQSFPLTFEAYLKNQNAGPGGQVPWGPYH